MEGRERVAAAQWVVNIYSSAGPGSLFHLFYLVISENRSLISVPVTFLILFLGSVVIIVKAF